MKNKLKEITDKQFKKWFDNLNNLEQADVYNNYKDDTGLNGYDNKNKEDFKGWVISNYRTEIEEYFKERQLF